MVVQDSVQMAVRDAGATKSLLRFVTCGSVDDGKSTLIGHMLYDAKLIYADQAEALELESKAQTDEGELDYSLLLDGLAAEREQGITIDVAYRFFSSKNRSFIVADCPGHEEYTRNMAVGASTSDVALILLDASKGLLPQTHRHVRICALMGIKHFVFAVNKMDLVNYSYEVFKDMCCAIDELMEKEYQSLSYELIPTSARFGDNLTSRSNNMSWYTGVSVLEYLEQLDVSGSSQELGFTFPVQRVCRPNSSFRGYEGSIASGSIHTGDTIRVLPSTTQSKVECILVSGKEEQEAVAGQAATLVLADELDVSRGCVLEKDSKAEASSFFSAKLLWMDDAALTQGRGYLVKLATQTVPGVVYEIDHSIDVTTGNLLPAKRIEKNMICSCKLSLSSKLVWETFATNRTLGSLILIDRVSNATVAAGVIEHKLSRSDNLSYHEMDITRELRESSLGQRACTLWFTGLSGSGKSTLANALEKRLHARGLHTMLLDGDNIRLGLNRNLGFTADDRAENIRRIAEVSKLMNDAGLIVLTSFISPSVVDRQTAAETIGEESFIEVFVSTPLEVCEKRDVKGLYAKARAGELTNFTGISSPYEPPKDPAISIDTSRVSLEDAVDMLVELLEGRD